MSPAPDEPTLPDGAPLFEPAGLEPGRRLGGRYVLEERLATGGAAVVWRAFDESLGRTVAVKVLHPGLVDDPDAVARFAHETRTGARVVHPSIVATLDAGRDDELLWLALEHIAGPSLLEVIRHRPSGLDPSTAAAIAELTCAGLAQVHAAGLVHRDVKPANLLLTAEGGVKLADFGVAGTTRSVDDAAVDGPDARRVGTPGYAPPEQLRRGARADPRADVYALGVVLHECLTGRPASPDGVLLPPRQVRPDVPRDLDAIVRRATDIDPARRFADGAEMGLALRRVLEVEPDTLVAAVAREVLQRNRASVADGARPSDGDDVTPASHASGAGPEMSDSGAGGSADRTDGTTSGTGDGPDPSRRRAGWAALVLALLIAVGWLTQLSTAESPDRSGPATSDVGVSVREVALFDPYGSVGTQEGDLLGAVDGDPGTAWSTPRYPVPLRSLGTPGVGLRLDLGRPVTVQSLQLLLDTPGVDVEVLTRDSAPPPGATEADWRPLAQRTTAGREVTFDLDGHEAQHWLVWFTDLQPSGETWHAALTDLRFTPVPAP